MRVKCFLLLIGLVLIVGSAAVLRLLPGQSENTNGEDAPRQQSISDQLAARPASTEGQVAKEQSPGTTGRPAAEPSEKGAPASPGGDMNAAKEERRSPTPNSPTPAAPDEPPVFQSAAAAFRSLDVNGDGLLTYDEMDDGLRAERSRWDTNGDGFIDLDEFRAYHRAHFRPNRTIALREFLVALEQQQVHVVRPSAMTEPKGRKASEALKGIEQSSELPEEYRRFDTDRDGQIGLYEWLAAGQPIEKFLEKDFNGDGFLTPDELLPQTAAEGEPDPGSLVGLQDQIGKQFTFRVTGAANGGVWGSGPYASDSTLAVTAVHAGALKVGETGTVRVRIVAPPESYAGSTAHDVTTQPFPGRFSGAYRVVR